MQVTILVDIMLMQFYLFIAGTSNFKTNISFSLLNCWFFVY